MPTELLPYMCRKARNSDFEAHLLGRRPLKERIPALLNHPKGGLSATHRKASGFVRKAERALPHMHQARCFPRPQSLVSVHFHPGASCHQAKSSETTSATWKGEGSVAFLLAKTFSASAFHWAERELHESSTLSPDGHLRSRANLWTTERRWLLRSQ